MKTLISLAVHNESAKNLAFMLDKPMQPNGIACPTCGSELVDASTEVLTSFPAQKRVKCLDCEFSGLRVIA